MNLRRAVIFLSLFVAVALTGCSSGSGPAGGNGSAPQPPTATVAANVSGKLPPRTPEGLPLWPGARVVVGRSPEEGPFTLLLETSDAPQEVVGGLGEGFEKAGWTVAESAEDSGTTSLEVANDELEGIISVRPRDGGSSIEYLLTPTGE